MVLSEPARPTPDAGVVAWLQAHSPLDLFISALTLGELAKGVALLPRGRRRDTLDRWLRADLPRQFSGRVLPIDDAVVHEWGKLSAEGQRAGRPLPVIDGLLLATAAVHRLILATRNERDCAGRDIPIHNPWTA